MTKKLNTGKRKYCQLYFTKDSLGFPVLGYQWVNALDQIREINIKIMDHHPLILAGRLRELAEYIEVEDRKERHPRAPIPKLGEPNV